MKIFFYVILPFFFYAIVFAQNSQDSTQFTHYLKLIPGEGGDTISTNAALSMEEYNNLISIQMPDGIKETEFVFIPDSLFKFQLAQINYNKLVAIHFVGSGESVDSLEGSYIAMVDGILRDDMSGTFIFVKAE